MTDNKKTVFSFFMILLISLILPLSAFADEAEEKQLYQTLEPIELEEGMVIPEGIYLYGEETEENLLKIQYASSYTTILKDLVIAEEVTDESASYHEVPSAEHIQQQLTAETTLTSTDEPGVEIAVKDPLAYPVHINENNKEVIYLGNVEYIVTHTETPADEAAGETTEEGLPEEPAAPEEDATSADTATEETSADADAEEVDAEDAEAEGEEAETEEAETEEAAEDAEGNAEDQAEAAVLAMKTKAVDPWKGVDSKYFEVVEDNVIVYDNRVSPLKPVGVLKKGQVYPRVSDYGNWHRIQFGNIYGYVKKASTVPSSGNAIKNENTAYKNTNRTFTALKDVTVYDNTGAYLVPFGSINKNETYSIASDYGNWWRVLFSDRVGYVRKSDVEENLTKSYFSKNDKYFRALKDAPIYDNRTGSLIKVGTLKKGKEYKRVSDYGNWHRIQFGNIYGYVRKSETAGTDGSSIKNENKSYNSTSRTFTALQDVTVYDNTSGSLVPFGTIDEGTTFSIATDYGNWWRVIFSDMVGYVRKSEVEENFTKSYFTKNDKYFTTLKDTPVYDNRTGSLVEVGMLEAGKEYKRVSDYGNWHRIQFGNIYGYVRKSDTEVSFGDSIPNENTKFTNSGSTFTALKDVTVYDNTSGSLVPFASINEGVTYAIADDYGGNWWRVLYSDMVGYVRKSEVQKHGLKIFLDPGHGAHDPGGKGYGLNEKDMVLDIARKTANFLRNYEDVEVKMSRSTDVFVPLNERARMANEWGADYFVSFHTNALNGSARGFETFIFNGAVSQETIDRQRDIHTYMAQRINIPDRGMKRANFAVLRESQMPAILLEYLFLDNKTENDLIRNASYRTTLARITAEAIAESYNLRKK